KSIEFYKSGPPCGPHAQAHSSIHIRSPGEVEPDEIAGQEEGYRESFVYRLDTVLLPLFATHIWAPSNATPIGAVPTGTTSRRAPSLARSFVRLLLVELATQMLVPSKTIPETETPAVKVPISAESLALSFITALTFNTLSQMLAPSNAMAV